jgi:hypothetical protein
VDGGPKKPLPLTQPLSPSKPIERIAAKIHPDKRLPILRRCPRTTMPSGNAARARPNGQLVDRFPGWRDATVVDVAPDVDGEVLMTSVD